MTCEEILSLAKFLVSNQNFEIWEYKYTSLVEKKMWLKNELLTEPKGNITRAPLRGAL